MRKSSNQLWLVLAAAAALSVPAVTLHAQGGRGGAAPVTNVPEPTSPVSGSAAKGKTLYYQYGCYSCHGYNGETGARPFVGRWGHLATEQTFITFLRGRANVAPVIPDQNMPNFASNTLSDKQAKDIYAYIRTFKSTAPRNVKDVPAFDAIMNTAKHDKD